MTSRKHQTLEQWLELIELQKQIIDKVIFALNITLSLKPFTVKKLVDKG